ncbi:MAG: tail fiber protein [Methyloprofundus sp.]|nr:tail fiber protein [Methyloprofundus sp.]
MTKKLIALIFYFCIHSAFAQPVPPLINYQGLLTDSEGLPLANGTKKLTFNIYDEAGVKKWGPQVFPSVPVINGYFNVILGPVKTDANGVPDQNSLSILDAFNSSNRYLGVTVENGTEVMPRQQILSTPYALTAAYALKSGHHSNIIPVGSVMPFAGSINTIPVGWLLCDGSAINRVTYADLFTVINTIHGSGDSEDSFHLPDYRGRFLRGVDHGSGRDSDSLARSPSGQNGNSGDKVGSIQDDAFKNHTHQVHGARGGVAHNGLSSANSTGSAGYDISQNTTDTGDSETRPKNAYINFIIKY